ncbi:patatin-like phospholipase family protein [Providencia sp. PROV033]|uniref:patatin-like phospholipase family protein n=1 Tax=Providencia sp. PROV033 TaxID=2949765 RepID=UPI002348F0B9|nr:patatin-like phospholipase family protein [Providencia sp. PROV033]
MIKNMKVGLALSGGGAIGAYEVGIVRALYESGTNIDVIAGASIGALNGAIISSSSDLKQATERLEEIWRVLGSDEILSVNHSAYLSFLLDLGLSFGLNPVLSKSGGVIYSMLKKALLTGKNLYSDTSLLSDQPLLKLMEQYLDTDALSKGVPLFVSVYPSDGGFTDIANSIAAEFGIGDTKDSEFLHIQSLPQDKQQEALLASSALPVLFKPREINGKKYSDGGIGGWSKMQGNTPVTPLVEYGCNMVVVTHLSDGSMWDRHDFPDTIVLEIRPQRTLKRNEGFWGGAKDLLGFDTKNINSWINQGYEDTLIAIERIRRPLVARYELRSSENMLEISLAKNASVDSDLKDAMSRLK